MQQKVSFKNEGGYNLPHVKEEQGAKKDTLVSSVAETKVSNMVWFLVLFRVVLNTF